MWAELERSWNNLVRIGTKVNALTVTNWTKIPSTC
jgi:hypothetical protein